MERGGTISKALKIDSYHQVQALAVQLLKSRLKYKIDKIDNVTQIQIAITVKTLYNVTRYNRIFNIRHKIAVSIKIPSL